MSAGEAEEPAAAGTVLDTDEGRGLIEAAQESGSLTTEEIALALGELDFDAA